MASFSYTSCKDGEEGYALAIWAGRVQDGFPQPPLPERLRIIFVESGAAIVTTETDRLILDGPCLFLSARGGGEVFLSDEALPDKAIEGQAVFFHPEVLNTQLSFPLSEGTAPSDTSTLIQDYYLLDSFPRHGARVIFLDDPLMTSRASRLFSDVATALHEHREPFWACEARSFLFEILFLARRLHEGRTESSRSLLSEGDPLIDRVLLHIHCRYMEDLGLESLARSFATNRTTLSRRFKAVTGFTLMAYIRDLRLKIAERLVRQTALPLTEIIERVGFGDRSYFTRFFTERYGIGPGAHRRLFSS